MKIIAVIPARFASTRLPGKPLALIDGKPMIRVVAENILSTALFEKIIVATDDERVVEAVDGVAIAVMTDASHMSGTDRCAEAALKSELTCDIIVNVQGDEPFVAKDALSSVVNLFHDDRTQIATVITPIQKAAEICDPAVVKVVKNLLDEAIYFSRAAIPFIRDANTDEWGRRHDYFRHIGIYAFRPKILFELVKLPLSTLEQAEKLEQLRWIENGYTIKVATTSYESISVDTAEDLEKANQFYLESVKKGH